MRMLQHQPSSVLLSGGGIWCRRHTWTSYRVQDLSQRHSTEVRPGMHARCISIETIFPLCCSLFNCHLFSQLLDSPGGFAVLSSRFAAKLLFDDSAPPGPEHHGLFAVALGPQQCHDDQSGPGHKEQPLYSGFASTYKEQIQKHVQIDLTVNWWTDDTFHIYLCSKSLPPFLPFPAGGASLLPDDELPLQVPGWWPDKS